MDKSVRFSTQDEIIMLPPEIRGRQICEHLEYYGITSEYCLDSRGELWLTIDRTILRNKKMVSHPNGKVLNLWEPVSLNVNSLNTGSYKFKSRLSNPSPSPPSPVNSSPPTS